jgi:hypothetical protein
MKYNLKNPLWQACPEVAKKRFEKELRELKDTPIEKRPIDEKPDVIITIENECFINIKEILGE